MTSKTREILEHALKLPAADKARLVDEILSSLGRPDPAVDDLWRNEVQDRIRAHAATIEPPRWQAEVFNRAQFDHRGKPFSLTTEDTPEGAQVTVRWGDDQESLYTQGLDDPRLPGLARHMNWLKIIALSK